MNQLPRPRATAAAPALRRLGPFSRPHKRAASARWRWNVRNPSERILEKGDPFFDERAWLSRKTPTDLTETELLASFNYLDGEALRALPGIGPTLAANILSQRAQIHYFASLDELALVPGIGARRFLRLTGRPAANLRFQLHDLMRVPRNRDILLRDLQPWARPAQGVASVHLHPPGTRLPASPSCVHFRIRRHLLAFDLAGDPANGRSSLLLNLLPSLLRTLLS